MGHAKLRAIRNNKEARRGTFVASFTVSLLIVEIF
jgi:hypothetical protein